MRRLLVCTFVAMLAATAVLLADGAYVDDTINAAAEADPATQDSPNASAGNTLVWCTQFNDQNTTLSLTFNNADTHESHHHVELSTTGLDCWVVANTAGGVVGATFDGSEGDDTAEIMTSMEISGLANTTPAEDVDGATGSGVTSFSSPSVTCAGACFLYGIVTTNRNPDVAGGSDIREESTPSGALNAFVVTRRESAGGTYDFDYTLDVSGIYFTIIYAFSEAAGAAASPLPAIINPIGRGGGKVIRAR